ncbi:MAG TPA: DinB family protein, partial [Vicinamibacterales bacterium]|nr:DinB family protein [Vicinamibacterales bacterium]
MRTVLAVVVAASWSTTAFAQAPATPTPASWLRGAYTNISRYIPRAAEKMPEEHYGMRPGTQTEVRTFGQLIGHLANYNYLWCSQAKGEKNPAADQDLEKLPNKAALVKAVNEALTYCDGV